MRHLIAALLALTAFLFALPAAAQPLTAVPPGEDQIVVVAKGQPAPFQGQLFDTPTALRWGNYLQQCRVRLVSDVELQKKLDDADLRYTQRVLELEREKYARVTAALEKRVQETEEELRHPPWYREPWFGVAVGVVATVGVLAGGAALVHAAQ